MALVGGGVWNVLRFGWSHGMSGGPKNGMGLTMGLNLADVQVVGLALDEITKERRVGDCHFEIAARCGCCERALVNEALVILCVEADVLIVFVLV
jgi:hypothetical protein